MPEKTRLLLFQIAAFLKMQAEGYVPVPPHVKLEAEALLEKVGKHLAEDADA